MFMGTPACLGEGFILIAPHPSPISLSALRPSFDLSRNLTSAAAECIGGISGCPAGIDAHADAISARRRMHAREDPHSAPAPASRFATRYPHSPKLARQTRLELPQCSALLGKPYQPRLTDQLVEWYELPIACQPTALFIDLHCTHILSLLFQGNMSKADSIFTILEIACIER